MKASLALFGLLALGPAISGPAPARAEVLMLALCGGGVVSLPLAPASAPGVPQGPCCAKGCHSSSSRKRFDRSQ
ncbi:MAG TPA: hypothetical protein PKD92_07860 [Novosphingobium sp.]|nr:hypothetical protein [Novosphingobium sp.]HMP56471.1 hypothetical protein [Novosphingobium sp.]